MADLPDPLTPADCDLTGMDWMPMHGHRLFRSDFYLRATDQEKVVALELWWAAWFQVPAASLPDDDVVIASLAGFSRDPKGWAKIRGKVLHGFVKCSDGRLYHRFLAQEAVVSFEKRLKSNAKRQSDRDRLQSWRDARRKRNDGGNDDGNKGGNNNETPSEMLHETSSETRFVAGRRDVTLPDKTRKKESRGAANALPTAKRGSRLPADWQPGSDGIALCIERRLNLTETLARFRDYWCAKAGKDANKLDWDATWRNWCRNEKTTANQPQFRNGFAQLHAERHGLPEQPQPDLPSFLRISNAKH